MAYTFEFPCENCSKVHKKTLPNKSSSVAEIISGKRKTFCSRECKKEYNRRNNRQTAHCENCGDIYRFFPSSNSKYCSRQCLSLAMKEDPVKFGLHERAEHMRKETDKQEATKKMLETKLEKGLIVDWNNATWKQWYRRCNAILQKRRKEMVEEWDGYDYIDGKYIKDNLKLPYYHRDYPTLDHVIPKQTLFKEGYTPEEACKKENLRWTTRSNNSKKGY